MESLICVCCQKVLENKSPQMPRAIELKVAVQWMSALKVVNGDFVEIMRAS